MNIYATHVNRVLEILINFIDTEQSLILFHGKLSFFNFC